MNRDNQGDGRAISALSTDLSKLQPIHSGSRHKLFRCTGTDAGVVVKRNAAESTSEGAAASVLHEFELLRDVELPGVVRASGLVDTGNGLALAMADAGDTNLTQRLQAGPLSIPAFLGVSVQLAEAVARLHGVRIVHLDIHPGNVVWDAEREVATLCDFATARTLPTLVLEGPNPSWRQGALPYMSPEQTGRTGRAGCDVLRAVDRRATVRRR
jgi:serine/threonine protein kinase